MKDFYTKFYSSIEHSPAHHAFCERVFGRDLGQHGFADMEQLDLLLKVTRLDPAHHALDLGCGNGMIAEYLSDSSGARITGLDFIDEAVGTARKRTQAKADRLSFVAGDINRLELPASAFDAVLSIDSIYFSGDYAATIRALKTALRPGGGMAFLYSFGREPWIPLEKFPAEKLPPDQTPLADALRANGLAFRTWELTKQDYQLAQRRKQILEDLKPQFEAEGLMFIYENRMGDALGVSQAIAEGLHARYLYLVRFPAGSLTQENI
ncbi:MAG: methyltransferase domain-containing protein [Anaerolineales bacterium]